MTTNRVTGIAPSTGTTPAAGGAFNCGEAFNTIVIHPATPAGTPAVIVNLSGAGGAGPPPADGDVITVTDAFGVLAAGTTCSIVGVAAAQGAQIADQAAAANSVLLNAAGARRSYMFSSDRGVWLVVGR